MRRETLYLIPTTEPAHCGLLTTLLFERIADHFETSATFDPDVVSTMLEKLLQFKSHPESFEPGADSTCRAALSRVLHLKEWQDSNLQPEEHYISKILEIHEFQADEFDTESSVSASGSTATTGGQPKGKKNRPDIRFTNPDSPFATRSWTVSRVDTTRDIYPRCTTPWGPAATTARH